MPSDLNNVRSWDEESCNTANRVDLPTLRKLLHSGNENEPYLYTSVPQKKFSSYELEKYNQILIGAKKFPCLNKNYSRNSTPRFWAHWILP